MSSAVAINLERKRKFGDNDELDGNDNEKRSQRRRASTTTALHATGFHECHLIMLKSLYNDESDDDSTWNQVKLFLQQRKRLLQGKKEREHLQHVHQAAVDHVHKQGKSLESRAASFTPPPPPPPQHLQSPAVNSVFSPLTMTPTKSQHGGGFTSTNTCSLALVARLLGKRAADATVTTDTAPFSSLLQEVNAHISKLQASLQTLQQERLERNRNQMTQLLLSSNMNNENDSINIDSGGTNDNDDDNKMVEVESKIYLWKMLAEALRQV